MADLFSVIVDTDGGWLVLHLVAGFVHESACAGINNFMNRPQHHTPVLLLRWTLFMHGDAGEFYEMFCRDLTKVNLLDLEVPFLEVHCSQCRWDILQFLVRNRRCEFDKFATGKR